MARGRWYRLLAVAALWLAAALWLRSCSNNPWPAEFSGRTLFTSYSAQIKTLDPQVSAFVHENVIIDSIVETPLHYHYLKRPYELEPRLLEEIPQPAYYDRSGVALSGDPPASAVARTEYILRLKPGICFQPHPAFAPDARPTVRQPRTPWDFAPLGTRELTAADLKAAMVRLCDRRVGSPIYSTFSQFLSGMAQCSAAIDAIYAAGGRPRYADVPLAGCEVLDRHTLRFTLSRKYPQFLYWLAVHYAAPVAQEVLDFYERQQCRDAGISYSRWPAGTGAFMLVQCDPERRIVLGRNPGFRQVRYPSEGSAEDAAEGRLDCAGALLPLLDRVVFNYERESIPNWLKFQQGYYDHSGVPNDMFDSAVAMNPAGGELALSPAMAARGMKLASTVPPISYYMAFNMLDPVVGGLTPQARSLRQALSMVIDLQEYIAIFKNGNGIAAEGIIPPGIFGQFTPPQSMNDVLNTWDGQACRTRRRSLAEAQSLMAAAGYPGGIDPQTGAPLVIHLDHAAAGAPDFKNRFQWLAARFRLLGVELVERPTDLNRNRDNLKTGNWQFLFERGWVADYPDPENFLMLFYSKNSHVRNHGSGPNYSNYSSPRFDAVFEQLETMPNGTARLELIRQAAAILAEDAPLCWLYHPVNTMLTHGWLKNFKPHGIANDTLQYLSIETPEGRDASRRKWNAPRWLPAWLALAALSAAALMPALRNQRGGGAGRG